MILLISDSHRSGIITIIKKIQKTDLTMLNNMSINKFQTIIIFCVISLSLSACSTQQVVGAGVAVAKVPVKAASGVAGVAGGVVGGTVGGLVAGSTGAKYGKMAGQRAAKKAVP